MDDNRLKSLVLKMKQQKAIQLLKVFLRFVKNKFLLFLHFPDLRNLSIT